MDPVRAMTAALGGIDLSGAAAAFGAPASPRNVVLIYEPQMQAHAPPRVDGIHELPCRIVAIESVLRGLPFDEYTKSVGEEPKGRPALIVDQHEVVQEPPVCYVDTLKSVSPEVARYLHGKGWTGSPVPRNRHFDRVECDSIASDLPLHVLLGTGARSVAGPYGDAGSEWRPLVVREGIDGIWYACEDKILAPLALPRWVGLVHTENHIRNQVRRVIAARQQGMAIVEKAGDMFYNPLSLRAALFALGGAIEAVNKLFTKHEGAAEAQRTLVDASFAIVRPPGHHCGGEKESGFCLFSNTATAAAYARHELGLARVAIVDTDYHPGDGSQSIFYDDASVLTISIHAAVRAREPDEIDKADFSAHVCWPWSCTKSASYRGRGDAQGLNINIPWPHEYVDDNDYEEALRTIVVPALRAFKPQLILWACGFDAVDGDTLAGLKLSTSGYFRIARHLASAVPDVPVAAVLEGGYSPEKISLAAENVVRGFLGRKYAKGNGDDSITERAWEPATPWRRETFPSPDHACTATSARRATPLGTPWRAPHTVLHKILRCAPGKKAIMSPLARPEAVLEHLRRSLNAEPAWQDRAAAAGVERVFDVCDFAGDGEPSVEEEAGFLESVLQSLPKDGGFPTTNPQLRVPWCAIGDDGGAAVRNLFGAADANVNDAAGDAARAPVPEGGATGSAEAEADAVRVRISSLEQELQQERAARGQLEAALSEEREARRLLEGRVTLMKERLKALLGEIATI